MKLKKMKKTKIIIKENVIYHIVIHDRQYLVKSSKNNINHITGIGYGFYNGIFHKLEKPFNLDLNNSSSFTTLSVAKPSLVRLSPFYNVIDKCLDIINQIENGNN